MVVSPHKADGMTKPIYFPGDWYGWRLQGRLLISPDGEHITQERLSGLLWRDGMELRLAGYASRRNAEKTRCKRQRVKVVIVELGDLRCGGAAAG